MKASETMLDRWERWTLWDQKSWSTATAMQALLLYRVMAAAVIVRTYLDPDEFWQSVEIAHRFAFGFGYETWEWQPHARLRGFTYPALFALVYKLVSWTHIDTPAVIRIVPNLVQAVIAAVGDFYSYKLADRWFGSRIAKFALFCQLTNWFHFVNVVRTYSNSTEMVLTTVALYYWPDFKGASGSKRRLALALAAICVIIRPTSVIFWLLLGIHLLVVTPDKVALLFGDVLPIGATSLALSLLIDYTYFGLLTFPMLNFFRFNFPGGNCIGAAMFGRHPAHWYFSQGLPAMLGANLPFMLAGIYWSRRWFPLTLIVTPVLFMSFNGHKEFRFIIPILPLCFMYCGSGLAELQARYETRKPFGRLYIWSLLLLVVANAGLIGYFGRWHQRAPTQLMEYLSDRIEQSDPSTPWSIDFLTECHSTPFYSYIHRRIPMRILECEPRFQQRLCSVGRHNSETMTFLREPFEFTTKYYAHRDLPSHIVLFDEHFPALEPFLTERGFVLEMSFFYSHFSASHYLLLYKRQQQ